MGFFRCLISYFLLLFAGHSAFAAPADNYRACESLRHCVNILERHGPDQFDYQVLAGDFARFGPKGTDRLIKMIGSNKPEQAQNAVDMLSALRPNLHPHQVDQLINVWPRDRSRSALLSLIENVQTPRANSEFRAGLMSGESRVVATAFNALARQNRDNAIRALQDAVFALENHQIDEALALSDLIVVLDEKDQGDTFRKYAFGLAQDEQIRPIANAVGLNAAVNVATLKKTLTAKLLQTSVEDWKRATESETVSEVPISKGPVLLSIPIDLLAHSGAVRRGYSILFENDRVDSEKFTVFADQMVKSNPEKWVPLRDKLHNENPASDPSAFIDTVSTKVPQYARPILFNHLENRSDFRSLKSAILGAAQVDPSGYQSLIAKVSRTHPVSQVRVLPQYIRQAELIGDKARQKELMALLIDKENRSSAKCEITQIDIRQRINEVPYFDWTKLKKRSQYIQPRAISSAWPRLDGWVMGFGANEVGGGLLFLSHDMSRQNLVLAENVSAIIPFRPASGQLYPDEYWVVTRSLQPSYKNIYRVSFSGGNPLTKFVARAPAQAELFGLNQMGALELSYGLDADAHPPLRISPDGTLSRACE